MIKMKARAVVERREKSLLSDPWSELRLGRQKERTKSARILDGMSIKNKTS